jgi:hypothetical protein
MVATELESPAWKINKQDRKSKDDIIISELGPARLLFSRSPLHASFFNKGLTNSNEAICVRSSERCVPYGLQGSTQRARESFVAGVLRAEIARPL